MGIHKDRDDKSIVAVRLGRKDGKKALDSETPNRTKEYHATTERRIIAISVVLVSRIVGENGSTPHLQLLGVGR